jgi:hypothetical protein
VNSNRNPDDFLASFAANESAQRAIATRLKNKVKKCPACAKPNAFTLDVCNACGHDIKSTEISYTNNVFSSFAYGIEKGPFPFTVSLRLEDEHFMAFDDLLGLSACHFNIIPTSIFMTDWRFLLRDPARGRALVDALHARCVSVLRTQFLTRPEWRRAVFRDSDTLTDDEIVRMVGCGFKYAVRGLCRVSR